MKILHLTETYPPINDGVAPVVYGCVSAQREMGATCEVACPKMSDLPDGVHTYHSLGWVADNNYPFGFPLPWEMQRLARLKPDVIHAHSPFVSMILAERLRKKLNKPIVLTYHSKYSYDIDKYANNLFSKRTATERVLKSLNSADEIWLPAPSIATHLRELGYSGGHYVVEHSSNLPSIEIGSDKLSELRTRFSISHADNVLLFVGRMVWHKNIRLLINALDALHSMGIPFKMLFIGEGSDRDAMEDYAADRRLDGLIRFIGQVEELERLCAFYELADLLVFPSLSDNMPPAVIEANAHGLPAVLIDGSDAAYGVEDGVTGFLCAERDLAECIANALSDKRRLKKIGAALRSQKRLTWATAVDKMLNRYEKLSK